MYHSRYSEKSESALTVIEWGNMFRNDVSERCLLIHDHRIAPNLFTNSWSSSSLSPKWYRRGLVTEPDVFRNTFHKWLMSRWLQICKKNCVCSEFVSDKLIVLGVLRVWTCRGHYEIVSWLVCLFPRESSLDFTQIWIMGSWCVEWATGCSSLWIEESGKKPFSPMLTFLIHKWNHTR